MWINISNIDNSTWSPIKNSDVLTWCVGVKNCWRLRGIQCYCASLYFCYPDMLFLLGFALLWIYEDLIIWIELSNLPKWGWQLRITFSKILLRIILLRIIFCNNSIVITWFLFLFWIIDVFVENIKRCELSEKSTLNKIRNYFNFIHCINYWKGPT